MPPGVRPSKPRSWLQYWREDLQQTPGRLASSLRIALTSVLVVVAMQVLHVPYIAYGLYVILLVAHDNPAVSLRMGIASIFAASCALSISLIVVILTDNDPMARVLSLAAITFVAGMITVATSVPALGPILGLIYGVGIAFWENHAPADTLVKDSLWLLAAISTGISGALAVGYAFASRSPADRLAEQLRTRYRALETMFQTYASDSTDQQRFTAAERVSRLAGAGQRGMLEVYNQIVDRNLESGGLPIGVRIHITLLAELMDSSAAFGLQAEFSDLELQSRCKIIAQQCGHLARELRPSPELELKAGDSVRSTHLDRVEAILRSLQTIPAADDASRAGLVALPSKQVPFLLPGAVGKTENVAFALKISLCATSCYILYHAVDWPGISTAVITVMITGLVSTGAMKQKLTFRFLGAIVGGLVLGLGAEVFLFPFIDSITSLVLVIGPISFLCAWVAGGPRFNYVGLQMAFAFYLTSLQGFGPPTELEPSRDRIVGILLATLVMWFVFDQIWPVRTITETRRVVASVLKDASRVVALIDTRLAPADFIRESDELRDRLGKQVSTVRMLNEATEYEFGDDRDEQIRAGDTLMQISMTVVALVWNQAILLHEGQGSSLSRPALIRLRQTVAQGLSSMADALLQKGPLDTRHLVGTLDLEPTADSDTEYARNTIARYNEVQVMALSLESPD